MVYRCIIMDFHSNCPIFWENLISRQSNKYMYIYIMCVCVIIVTICVWLPLHLVLILISFSGILHLKLCLQCHPHPRTFMTPKLWSRMPSENRDHTGPPGTRHSVHGGLGTTTCPTVVYGFPAQFDHVETQHEYVDPFPEKPWMSMLFCYVLWLSPIVMLVLRR